MGLQDRDWYHKAIAEREDKLNNNNGLTKKNDLSRLLSKLPGKKKKRKLNLFDVLILLSVLTGFLVWMKKAGIT